MRTAPPSSRAPWKPTRASKTSLGFPGDFRFALVGPVAAPAVLSLPTGRLRAETRSFARLGARGKGRHPRSPAPPLDRGPRRRFGGRGSELPPAARRRLIRDRGRHGGRDFQEELTCAICLDYFADPVSIECSHNYCHRLPVPHLGAGRRPRPLPRVSAAVGARLDEAQLGPGPADRGCSAGAWARAHGPVRPPLGAAAAFLRG